TDIGFTGGGKGTHQVYINGLPDHRLKDEGIVDHLVALVEDKAKQIEAERAAAEAAAAQAAE
ncbi:4-hydroxy-3-methylbut-2-en-1-yl diphosphate synthase, partial [Inquilinus limosus]